VKFDRPRVEVDAVRLAKLRSKGASFAAIAKETGLSVGTVFRALGSAGNTQVINGTHPH
jgi:lambda repressor-like predicted transcriptional regulator